MVILQRTVLVKASAIAAVAVFISGAFVVGAATVEGPVNAPLDVSSLNPAVDLSDYVSKSELVPQRMKGPLEIFNNGSYPVRGGYSGASGERVGIIGYGATSGWVSGSVPAAITGSIAANAKIGAYGFTDGGYGLYGVSTGGSGVAGRVNKATDYAGYFTGPVSVIRSAGSGFEAKVSVQRTLTANKGITANNTAGLASVQLTANSVPANTKALSAVMTGPSSNNAALSGVSTALEGIAISATNEIVGATAQGDNSYGIYGYSSNGNGVVGEADAARTNARGVYGRGLDYGVYGKAVFPLLASQSGAGIFACGTVTAGDFAGDVRAMGGLNMGVTVQAAATEYPNFPGAVIGRIMQPQVSMTEAMLLQVASACTGGSISPCTSNPVSALP